MWKEKSTRNFSPYCGAPLLEVDYCPVLKKQTELIFDNNPRGNADIESMIRTMKEELFWPREWMSERELSCELYKWVEYYNRSYLHSAHGYRTPVHVEEEYYKITTLQLYAA